MSTIKGLIDVSVKKGGSYSITSARVWCSSWHSVPRLAPTSLKLFNHYRIVTFTCVVPYFTQNYNWVPLNNERSHSKWLGEGSAITFHKVSYPDLSRAELNGRSGYEATFHGATSYQGKKVTHVIELFILTVKTGISFVGHASILACRLASPLLFLTITYIYTFRYRWMFIQQISLCPGYEVREHGRILQVYQDHCCMQIRPSTHC